MIVGILGPAGCGGTFLDWSLHFLSGKKNYVFYNFSENRDTFDGPITEPLLPNPLNGINAHHHRRSHPSSDSIDGFLKTIRCQNLDQLQSFYYIDNLPGGRHHTNHREIVLSNPDIKFINLCFDLQDIDMIWYNMLTKIPNSTKILNVEYDLPDWDLRERYSLYYHNVIFDMCMSEPMFETDNTFNLRFRDYIGNKFDITSLFDFLSIPLDEDRISDWTKIYQLWQKTFSLDFFEDIDEIISDIINNKDRDLSRYRMDLGKESVILKHLLYSHDFCVKSFNISKIGTNTRDWNQLLEKNVYHDLVRLKTKRPPSDDLFVVWAV